MSKPTALTIGLSENDLLTARLLSCLPGATFEMETLCRLAGIKTTRDIKTAAVECVYRPRMLINPDFVHKYCKRDEHLFLLVMHELWHIILAHTRLYPRATMAENIAFDAIINATLARQFSGPEYGGFFEVLNRADEFPGCLLRPPVGWPDHPTYPDIGPKGAKSILQRLYPPRTIDHHWTPPLYEEILNLLKRHEREKGNPQKGEGEGDGESVPVLIGNHEPDSEQRQNAEEQFFEDVVKRVASSWPAPPKIIGQRGNGSASSDWFATMGMTTEQARRAFAQVLRRAMTKRPGGLRRRMKMPIVTISGRGVLPNPRDRQMPARRLMGVQSVLWNTPAEMPARVPDYPSKTYVYLDVSGSMNQVVPHLLSLLLPYVRREQCEVFQFSTIVEPLPLTALEKAHLKTTRGTDINSILRHLRDARPPLQRAVIVTDGLVGKAKLDLRALQQEREWQLHFVLPYEAAHVQEIENMAASITILPTMNPQTRWK